MGLFKQSVVLRYNVSTKEIFCFRLPHAPLFMQRREDREYDLIKESGYAIFVKAKKKVAH